MIPLRIRIQNFRSFKKEQELELPQEPGLYFMEGANESEPRLEANGAGKSTVWEALTWCLYGKTSRGLKAGDVSSWDVGKGTRVEVDYATEANEPRTVRRTWGPISHKMLTYDGEHDLAKGQDSVLADLGLDYDPFLGCVFMAQGARMFLDLKASEREALFSRVMDLDQWIGRSEEASRRAKEDDAECRRLEGALARAEGALEALEGSGPSERLRREWEADREGRLSEIERQFAEADEHSTHQEDLRHAEKVEEQARAELRRCVVARELRASLDLKTRSVEEVARRAAVLRDRCDEAEEQLRRAERGEDCRSCGQSLSSKSHLMTARRRYETEEAELDLVEVNLEKLRKERDEYAAELKKAADAEDLCREALRDAEYATKEARRARDSMERWLRDLGDEHERLKEKENPHDAAARELRDRRGRLEGDAREARRSLEDRQRRREIHSYWTRAFKEVRLGLIAEALTELEVEVNSSCEALGLVGWELRFSADRETKSGSISRGFSVSVRAPGMDQDVPWDAWSGGEAQRLRLAAQMGLADLVRARTGATVPLEVWDEPTQGLSPQGVDDLLECLRERALREGRQIWLVDHRTHAFGGFSGGARIVKAPSGSRVRRAA